MSGLERETVERFHLLEPAAKQRVLQTLASDVQIGFDYGARWAQVETLQTSIRSNLGNQRATGHT